MAGGEVKAGATRIVRIDPHNVAVERLTEIQAAPATDTKPAREARLEWQQVGYYVAGTNDARVPSAAGSGKPREAA